MNEIYTFYLDKLLSRDANHKLKQNTAINVIALQEYSINTPIIIKFRCSHFYDVNWFVHFCDQEFVTIVRKLGGPCNT